MTVSTDSERITPEDPVVRIMRVPVASVPAERTAREVAEELAADEVGAVLVDGPHGPIGLVSERDVVTLLGTGGDPDVVQAVDLMDGELVWVGARESIATAAMRMRHTGVRHLPVKRSDGVIVGMVSVRDLLTVLAGTER
ncbi:CBS domain-containing protein [Pseudonocardia sp. RS11V-5]|uniref:CBS domain-containing protein n=1 Tax=Pseudonocardia terrae TaxID=2905831 RepID=UPI001E2F0AEC|nr:CBS domain-containing protein [Pseudonocardia terrae]MCE3553150.1 CBS domain-containing protein [Pseudonocardia terrae]